LILSHDRRVEAKEKVERKWHWKERKAMQERWLHKRGESGWIENRRGV